MRDQRWVKVVAIVLILALVLALGAAAFADEPSGSSGSEVPSQGIVPKPNSGTAPEEAGDRGGALQLLVLAGVVVAVGGTTARLVRQSRGARRRHEVS